MGGKVFVFIFKYFFLGTIKFGGHDKNLGGTAPERTPVATGLGLTEYSKRLDKLPLRPCFSCRSLVWDAIAVDSIFSMYLPTT